MVDMAAAAAAAATVAAAAAGTTARDMTTVTQDTVTEEVVVAATTIGVGVAVTMIVAMMIVIGDATETAAAVAPLLSARASVVEVAVRRAVHVSQCGMPNGIRGLLMAEAAVVLVLPLGLSDLMLRLRASSLLLRGEEARDLYVSVRHSFGERRIRIKHLS